MKKLRTYLFTLLTILLANFSFSQDDNQAQIVQIIQQGTENLILSGQVSVDSFITINQYGNNNNLLTNNSKNLHLTQNGNQNFIGVYDYLPDSSAPLTINQNGVENSVITQGTNSIIENAIITQNGNGLSLTITNEQ